MTFCHCFCSAWSIHVPDLGEVDDIAFWSRTVNNMSQHGLPNDQLKCILVLVKWSNDGLVLHREINHSICLLEIKGGSFSRLAIYRHTTFLKLTSYTIVVLLLCSTDCMPRMKVQHALHTDNTFTLWWTYPYWSVTLLLHVLLHWRYSVITSLST